MSREKLGEIQVNKGVYIVECNHVGKKSAVITRLDHVALEHGHHTAFMLMRCECGGIFGFPQENFELAEKEGTAEVKQLLAKLKQTNFK